MQTKKMEIKGIKDGLIIKIGSGKWAKQEKDLFERINAQEDFFQGARLALDVENHILKAAKLGALRDKLADSGVRLWAVISNSPTTEKAAQALGMATRLANTAPLPQRPKLSSAKQEKEAVFIRRTIRSGQKIKSSGHIIILGDVNPGAEVIAGGNIVVWGHLRGVAHAGAQGDLNAVVCALRLAPTQLRIAEKISISPPDGESTQPELACLEKGQIVAHSWA
ncbi:MAG: septum site-determining protein MinC [Anaerolineaceae bacterium 4572_5.1]|nr:MAG: septum site-determining protein MinC [Anaerolineaceae bacterium 4572_5.1]RLD07885.1 MAG: septum site-determining protein MinC [Chloroflexota bacterium]